MRHTLIVLICLLLCTPLYAQKIRVTGGGGGSVEGTAVLSTGEGGASKFLREDGDGTSSWQTPAGSGDVTDVGDCTTGACLDGTSDGGTWIKFYDAQGAGTLILPDLSGAVTWTLPSTAGTLLNAVPVNDLYDAIVFNFKSFGQAIAASTTLSRTIPYAGTITGWEIFSSASGSMVCTINKSTTSSPNAPSWAAISGSEKPTLSTAVRNTDTSLSSWTTAVAAGNQIQCSVDATPDITGTVTVVIYITKT